MDLYCAILSEHTGSLQSICFLPLSCATAVHEDSFYLSMVYKTNTSRSEAEILFSDDRTSGPLSFTCFPVVAFHVDTEHRNPLPLHVVVVEIYIRDGDVPGREVSRGAGGGCCLHGGIILQHHHGFLHLEQKEVREVWLKNTSSGGETEVKIITNI